MKSNLWVLCGIVLLCFGNVKCKKYFSDEDDNFLDKTGGVDEIKSENEEDLEWELYKARHMWNEMTNELEKLQKSQKGPVIPRDDEIPEPRENDDDEDENGPVIQRQEEVSTPDADDVDEEGEDVVPGDFCKEVCGEKDDVTCGGDKTKKETIECSCQDKSKNFDKDAKECKDVPDFCKEVCGEKTDVICGGDKTKKETTECSCQDTNKKFDKDAKECKEDKCLTECGIPHGVKNDELECVGGPFGRVQCKCKDPENQNLAFDSTDKTCKIDYCLTNCKTVTCKGNKFEDNVKCVCPSDKDFDDEKKECRINYCRKVCGTHELISCEGDPFENKKTKDCSCSDSAYIFTNKKCQKTCSADEDCLHKGECKGADGSKLCSCKSGLSGDLCDVINACVSGTYKNCNGGRGSCEFKDEDGKAVCVCPDGKDLYTRKGYCEVKCNNNDDCGGSNKMCNSDKFCDCQAGHEGEDCGEVTGCKKLKAECDKIEKQCIFDKNAPDMATCECPAGYVYDRKNNTCKHSFCHPNPCKGGATCDDDNGTGYCKCPENQYYNYNEEKCEAIAVYKCLLRKTPCDKHEKCVNGKCECKYAKDGDVCKPKLCTPNPCFQNGKCSEEDGSCSCEAGKYFNKKCEALKCSFEDYEKKCDCPSGMKRAEGSDKCDLKDTEECSKNCGYGLCRKKGKTESCKCFSKIAVPVNGTCILNKIFCAGGQLQNGLMKCKCEGQYIQADDGVTCRLKTCADEGVEKECASKGGKCVMNWKGIGYSCECPDGYIEDTNGICIDPCSKEDNIKTCAESDQFCYNSLSAKNKKTGDCQCPPTAKKDDNGKCTSKAQHVYLIKNIFVLKDRYEIKSGINKVRLNADLMQSLEQTFSSSVFDYGYLYDYRVSGDAVNCSVWINFKQAPGKNELEKVKAASKKLTKACEDCIENVMIWPPNLLLSDTSLNKVESTELTFCSDEVKDILCGKGAKCQDNKCTCKDGFKLIEYSIKTVGGNTVQRCEDVDECATNSHSCGKNTTCVNTYGSYKCVCNEGYKKAKTPDDPETDKSDCYDMCSSPYPCGKGECSLNGKTFNCQCQPGVGGSFCDREDKNYKSAKHGTVVVGAVLGTLLAVVAIAMLYYIIKVKKRSGSEDFMPAPRMDRAEMTERRPVRGVTNRAYE